jgi:NitT/TauT family transport system ATP-binding protein
MNLVEPGNRRTFMTMDDSLSHTPVSAPPASSGVLAQIRDLRLSLGGVDIYDGISFDIRQGEFLCILGPSGCGKSTLLRLLGDLIQPTSGDITIHGQPPAAAIDKIAYVFQSPRLVAWRTALGNVTLSRELRFGGKPDEAARRQAAELLELVGLGNDGHKYPLMLSGGERQRVAIARALAVEPEIILIDEPLSALDINTRQRLRARIIDIWRMTGKTIVFITHDIDDALTFADRVLVLSGKPSRILDTVSIGERRPRQIDAKSSLAALRAKLSRLFADGG